MTVEALLLAVTTLIAVVAVVVAVVAIRAVRRLSAQIAEHADESVAAPPAIEAPAALETVPTVVVRPAELEPRVVSGRVVVPPTRDQVLRTALGRPGVRLSILAHGLARALRPDNRDRIVALMRREYRGRRRERLRAGRQAMRQPVVRP